MDLSGALSSNVFARANAQEAQRRKEKDAERREAEESAARENQRKQKAARQDAARAQKEKQLIEERRRKNQELEEQMEREQIESAKKIAELERQKAEEQQREKDRLEQEAQIAAEEARRVEEERLQLLLAEKAKKEMQLKEAADRRAAQMREADMKADMLAREIALAQALEKKEKEAESYGIKTKKIESVEDVVTVTRDGNKKLQRKTSVKTVWQMSAVEKEKLLQEAEVKLNQTKQQFEKFRKERKRSGGNYNESGYLDIEPPINSSAPEFKKEIPLTAAPTTMLDALLDDDDSEDENWIPQQVKYKEKGDELHDAAKNGDLSTLIDLLEEGAPANKSAGAQTSAMHWAARNGHPAIISALVKYDGDVNAKNKYEYTPMHWAAYMGHVACIQELAQAGANLDIKDSAQATPLHWAVSANVEASVRELVNMGADIDAMDASGQTPLHWAVTEHEHGRPRMIGILIDAGADFTIRQRQNLWTALDLAKNEKKSEAVNAITAFSENVSTQKMSEKEARRQKGKSLQKERAQAAKQDAIKRRQKRQVERQSFKDARQSVAMQHEQELQRMMAKNQQEDIANREVAKKSIISDEEIRKTKFKLEQQAFIAHQLAKEENAVVNASLLVPDENRVF